MLSKCISKCISNDTINNTAIVLFVIIHISTCICFIARVAQLDITTHTSLSPIRRVFVAGFARLTAANDKVYQLLDHGRWFFPGTPASSTTKYSWNIVESRVIKQKKSKSIFYNIHSILCGLDIFSYSSSIQSLIFLYLSFHLFGV